MLKKLSDMWDRWSIEGLKLPYLFDPTSKQPSITLGMLYIVSLIMFGSLIALHLDSALMTATLVTTLIWVLSYVMYRLRKLDKVKIDLKNQQVDLEDNSSDETSNGQKENK